MKSLGVCSFLMLFLGVSQGFGEVEEDYKESSLVKKLTAVCSKDGIKVNVRFATPFHGIVYSDGHYDTANCVFFNGSSSGEERSVAEISFLIPADDCGTVFHDPGSTIRPQNNGTGQGGQQQHQHTDEKGNEQDVYMENTVMFQRNHFIQEQGDLAQTLRCVWQKEIRRPLHATLPFRTKQTARPFRAEGQTRNVTSSSSRRRVNQNVYSPSFAGRQAPPKTGFLPKGQVESVSFGRRSGKSFETPSERYYVTRANVPPTSLPNLTALAFKQDSSSSTSGAGLGSVINNFTMCNYGVVVILINVLVCNILSL